MFTVGKICVDDKNQFRMSPDQSAENHGQLDGIFIESSSLTMQFKDVFADFNVDKFFNCKYDVSDTRSRKDRKTVERKEKDYPKAAAFTFFDLIDGDSFDYTPPYAWILAESLNLKQKNQTVTTIKELAEDDTIEGENTSLVSWPISKFKSLFEGHVLDEQQVFTELHENFRVPVAHLLSNDFRHGQFIVPQSYIETPTLAPSYTFPSAPGEISIFFKVALDKGVIDPQRDITVREMSLMLNDLKRKHVTEQRNLRKEKKVHPKILV